MKKLSPEDSQIVDLLLDRDPTKPAGAVPTNGDSAQRVERVEAVFRLLDQFTVDEPSGQLINKTMRLVDAASAERLELGGSTGVSAGDTHFPA